MVTSNTFCHWKPLLQKVGAVVILFLADLFLDVGADGKVLTIPPDRAASTQKDAVILGVLSHKRAMSRLSQDHGNQSSAHGFQLCHVEIC